MVHPSKPTGERDLYSIGFITEMVPLDRTRRRFSAFIDLTDHEGSCVFYNKISYLNCSRHWIQECLAQQKVLLLFAIYSKWITEGQSWSWRKLKHIFYSGRAHRHSRWINDMGLGPSIKSNFSHRSFRMQWSVYLEFLKRRHLQVDDEVIAFSPCQ